MQKFNKLNKIQVMSFVNEKMLSYYHLKDLGKALHILDKLRNRKDTLKDFHLCLYVDFDKWEGYEITLAGENGVRLLYSPMIFRSQEFDRDSVKETYYINDINIDELIHSILVQLDFNVEYYIRNLWYTHLKLSENKMVLRDWNVNKVEAVFILSSQGNIDTVFISENNDAFGIRKTNSNKYGEALYHHRILMNINDLMQDSETGECY